MRALFPCPHFLGMILTFSKVKPRGHFAGRLLSAKMKPEFVLPPKRAIYWTWIITIVIYTLHPIGQGAWVIILFDFLKFGIAKNDLAKATALWGSYELFSKISKLITSAALGEMNDRFGRKRTMQLNFLASICTVVFTYFLPSVFTFWLGAGLSCLDIMDIGVFTTIADVGKALVLSSRREGSSDSGGKVSPEGKIPTSHADEEDFKTAVAKQTTWMYGFSSATWVISIGVGATLASVLVAEPAEAQGDVTMVADNSTALADCLKNSTTNIENNSHYAPAVTLSLCGFIPGLLITTFFFRETSAWIPEEMDFKAQASEKPGVVESFRLLMGNSTWLRILTTGIMFTEACQNGTINVLFWFGSYHFAWDLVDFTVFLLYALVLSSIGVTCMLKLFLRVFGLWGSLDISCWAGIIGLPIMGLSGGVLGELFLYIGVMANLFNVGKPVLRGKICAEFPVSEQGKVQGALYVVIACADILGTFTATSLLALAIMYEQGVTEVEEDGCIMNQKPTTWVGGAPFYGLRFLALLALVCVQIGKRYEPKS